MEKRLHCWYHPPSTNFSPLHSETLLWARVTKCGAKPPGSGCTGPFIVSVGGGVEWGLPSLPMSELFVSGASCPTPHPCQCVSQHPGSPYDQRVSVQALLWFDTRRYPKMSSIPGALNLLNEAIWTLTMRSNEAILSQSYRRTRWWDKVDHWWKSTQTKNCINWELNSGFQSISVSCCRPEPWRESKREKETRQDSQLLAKLALS